MEDTSDRVEVPGGILEVERMDGRRIDRISFLPVEPAESGQSGDGASSVGGIR